MSLRELLRGNIVAIGKNYSELSGDEIRALIYFQVLSNSNNAIVATNLNVLSAFSGIDKRYLSDYIDKLVEKEKISIDGDIKKYCNIVINIDDNFEKFNVDFVLDLLNELKGSELKLYCTMIKHLNIKKNKNYIYPSMDTLVEGYYSAEELIEGKLDDKLRYINKLKNKLVEKGYIDKIVAYYFETKGGDKGKSTLGYFMRTGENEVLEEEYYSFVKNEISKYNESHENVMKLATEDYLKKCKYKNLDKYIYYVHQDKKEVVENEVIQQVEVANHIVSSVGIEENLKEILECNYSKNKLINKIVNEILNNVEVEYSIDVFIEFLNDWKSELIRDFEEHCNDSLHRANKFNSMLDTYMSDWRRWKNNTAVHTIGEEEAEELDWMYNPDGTFKVDTRKVKAKPCLMDVLCGKEIEKTHDEKSDYEKKLDEMFKCL